MKKSNFKSRVASMALAAALAASVCAPVCAASREADDVKGSSDYVEFNDLKLYNGVVAYTQSGQNFDHSAYVKMTKSSLSYVNVATYTTLKEKISSSYSVSIKGECNIPSAANYPGEYICLGCLRDNISGEQYVTGRFYPDGV